MRIVEDYNEVLVDSIEINSAVYIGDYAIRLFFNDGVCKLVDFKSFLENSSHPSIKKYLDESKFKEFLIVDGNLNWNDYDLIFPIADLYQGVI
ncbi:MAG: hypothetical protein RI952_1666 [Bacteroidota bacterium]|jgi:hypothetical protein